MPVKAGVWGPRPQRAEGGASGFTLLEVLIVLVIVGLATALIAFRGPSHSAALDLRATAQSVAETLRLARSRAIAENRAVGVTFDLAAHTMRLDGAPPERLPLSIQVAVTATTENATSHLAVIRFAPDGSASGGQVQLADSGRRATVGINWLLGRVTLANGP